MIQIGARKMRKLHAVARVGRSRLPVLLKRGDGLRTLRLANGARGRSIMSEGNTGLLANAGPVPCPATPQTLSIRGRAGGADVSRIAPYHRASHGTGKKLHCHPLARAASCGVGADG